MKPIKIIILFFCILLIATTAFSQKKKGLNVFAEPKILGKSYIDGATMIVME